MVNLLDVKNRFCPRVPPALVLFFLSPAIAELLSGSSPPAEFFNPITFVLIVPLYGSGVIVIRELKIRWKKGIGSLLLLGAAYGILEEGLMVASFFNPAWPDVGILGVFGRWLGINWVWALELTIYHAIVSITIPIMLVELAYPELKGESWISSRVLKALFVLLAGVVSAGFFLISKLLNYWPPVPQYLLMASLMAVLIYCAYRLPANWARHGTKPLPRPLFFGVISMSGTVAGAFIFGVIPHLTESPLFPPIVMFLGVSLVFGVTRFLREYNWRQANDLHKFGLAAGALTPLIVFAPLQELDKTRTDNPAGMSLVGLAFLIGLAWLGWRIRKRTQTIGKPTKVDAAQQRIPRFLTLIYTSAQRIWKMRKFWPEKQAS